MGTIVSNTTPGSRNWASADSSFFCEISSNGCGPPVTAGVSWWSAMIGGCRAQQTSMERLNRLREANSQWEGIPINNGPRKKWIFKSITTNWKWQIYFHWRLVCSDETERWSREMAERLLNKGRAGIYLTSTAAVDSIIKYLAKTITRCRTPEKSIDAGLRGSCLKSGPARPGRSL